MACKLRLINYPLLLKEGWPQHNDNHSVETFDSGRGG